MKVSPYIAYKGTTSLMQCYNNYKFEVGKIYSVTTPREDPQLCTKDGFHYCDKLEDVFIYYPILGPTGDNNRYFEVEIHGFVNDPNQQHLNNTGDKRITTSLKFLRELSEEEINVAIESKKLKDEDVRMKLPIIRELQKKYPEIIITGSIALYLQGINLKRFNFGNTDIDIVVPHYIKIDDSKNSNSFSIEEEISDYGDDNKDRGHSFDFRTQYNGISIDVCIDNKQKYMYVTRNNFTYKVCPVERILAAKCSYAMKGQLKHRDDIYEMLGL